MKSTFSITALMLAVLTAVTFPSAGEASDGPFLHIDDVFHDSPAVRIASSIGTALDSPAAYAPAWHDCTHDALTSCCDCNDCSNDGCCGETGFHSASHHLDNIQLFFATDGWQGAGDGDDANNFGFRSGINTSWGVDAIPVRVQLGASFGIYDLFGRESGNERRTETQAMGTAGIYQRSNVAAGQRISWGFVWDQMASNGWGKFGENGVNLSQMRWRGGYAITERDEIGMWGTEKLTKDFSVAGNGRIRPLNSVNLFYHRNWTYGADTTVYFGLSERPVAMVFGLSGQAPLSSRVAMFVDAHYMMPDATAGDVAPNGFDNTYAEEYWNVSVGIAVYLGGNAVSRNVSGNLAAPLFPVANNGTFTVKGP